MVITTASNPSSLTSGRALGAPTASVGGFVDGYQAGSLVEPPPPGYNPTSPEAMKVNTVAAVGMVAGLAGVVAGLTGGLAGGVAGAIAGGAAGFALGRFAGLAYDISNLGGTDVTNKASAAGAIVGAAAGAFAGISTGSPLAAAILGLAGGVGGAWGAAMVVDP